MAVVFQKTKGLTDTPFTYCPGCTHGIIHRLVAECLEELEILDRTIAIASVGCSVMSYEFFNCDAIQAAHGRAPAVATGVKRVHPDKIVFTYQGDGDLASIGTGEIVQAAHRGDNITVIFVNNAIYGMTGGQMAPTTLPGQITTTSPYGRDVSKQGEPIRMAELMAQIPGAAYIERVMTADPVSVRKAKRAIKKAFEIQKNGGGFSMIEILSSCNIGWGLSPVDSLKYIKEEMASYFP
ncbi:MAG: thiamine pyrophosphate-dependent enzyme, partial [Erysipelotrichaceae bacterium]|nr:thiamine pyrophosphate-dependent enzyme [Erysipelotrichaceae bacterium]